MLYKNHKKVNLSEDPYFKKRQTEFDKFLRGKSDVLFKTHDKLIFQEHSVPPGLPEPERSQVIPVEVTVINDDGDYDSWIYLEKSPRILPNGEPDYESVRKPIIITRNMTVSVKEKKDLIFFLMYLSTAGRTGRIFAFDEESEDKKRYDTIRKASNVDYLLTGDYSPLKEDGMRRIAKSFGVPNVDKMSQERVVLTLKAMVDKAEKEGDKSCDVAAFIQAMEEDGITATKSMVQEAIDAGRIVYDEPEGTWFYTDESGVKVKKIRTVDLLLRESKIQRIKVLHDAFIGNEKAQKELSLVMGYTTIEVDFRRYTYPSLKKFAAQLGIDATGKADELLERVSEYYEANKGIQKIDLTCLALNQKIGQAADGKHEDGTGIE